MRRSREKLVYIANRLAYRRHVLHATDEEAILVEYKEQLKRATERVNEQEARLRLLREVLTLETEEQSASTEK